MAKTLAGKGIGVRADQAMLEAAKTNLFTHFSVFAQHTHVDLFIEHYLRGSGLPNVITPNINVTAPKFLINSAQFEAEIRELNKFDDELFSFVVQNERIPASGTDDGSVHPLTMILVQDFTAKDVSIEAAIVPTNPLRQEGILNFSVDSSVLLPFITQLSASGILSPVHSRESAAAYH